jgi:hypothetical protein
MLSSSVNGPTSIAAKCWKNGECSDVASSTSIDRAEPETT